ncbi:MutS-related protein [Prevotella fusca]|uniref:DNA mismatch repair protein MutS n=1 Tax=Prevotella fusca JCM 17724 TaxID=1236517 RepID=A0A0K1NK91_9BACT|nr:DNA mismatch repair protein MutS [Prevotella fusca]AKU69096.1 DNA mismatch repair protein MutS [Prevotella fusca JCM 17724]QUB86721.1 DNA mismatch repair protein MutS [Prevotella fusca JCM 17724]
MNKDLTVLYQQKAEETGRMLISLRNHSRAFILTEIGSFLLAIGFVVLYTLLDNAAWALLCALAALFLYLYIRRLDVRNDRKIKAGEALLQVYQNEIDYQHGNFSGFEAGEQYVCPQHSYTFDMDVFGTGSLFQRMNRSISTGGSDRLAACLSTEWGSAKREELVGQIRRRTEAVDELGQEETFLSEFKSLGVKERINTEEVLKALTAVHHQTFPKVFHSPLFRYFCYADLLGFYVSIVLSIMGLVPSLLPVWWGMFNFMFSFLSGHKHMRVISELIAKVHTQVDGYLQVLKLINSIEFKSAELQALKEELSGAVESFEQLGLILQKIDNRSNEIGVFVFNSFALIDVTIVRLFLRWQHAYEQRTNKWVDTLNLFDALVSMGNYRLNEDKAVQAEIIEDDKVVYEAKGLYHPFLGEQAVANDFNILDHEYYIITGANMAGKSTFLRSLGINYLLAMNGLPVFANQLKVSVFHLFTSMRTTDDLTHGISYFNAELLRLKKLLGSLRDDVPSLIILDEILKGTNSLDKLNGSRLFLQYIAERNVTGVIATHDLELSKMEEEYTGRFHNYCFEIELGENITYSYKITEGVARNQNATFLLKGILSPSHTRKGGLE